MTNDIAYTGRLNFNVYKGYCILFDYLLDIYTITSLDISQ